MLIGSSVSFALSKMITCITNKKEIWQKHFDETNNKESKQNKSDRVLRPLSNQPLQ